MVRMPSEYQEVEYIESTGTQYIDLDFGFYITDEIQMRGAMTKTFQDKYLVAPKQWNTDNNRFSMLGGHGSFMFTLGQQGTPNNILSPAMEGDNNFHTVTYANKIFTVVDTGSIADMTTKSFGSETANIRLFYGYANNTHGKIAFYHHKKEDGTEINLIPCYKKSSGEIGMYDTVSKHFFTNSGTGTFLKGNDVTYDNINLLESRRRILLNTPHIETVSDTIASFKTDIATKIKECKIHFTPIQEGEGDPSPDNVRPITGWDGVVVTACGKNLLDAENPDEDGFVYCFIPKGSLVTCSGTRSVRVNYYDKDKTLINYWVLNWGTVPNCYRRFTVEKDAYYWKISANNVNFQLELSSSKSDYEPYTATTLTIPFPQTIYGGYVDLVKGEVVEEWGDITLDSLNWNLSTTAKRARYTYGHLYITPTSTVVPQAIAEEYKAVSANYYVTNKTFAMTNGGVFVFYYEDKIPTGKLCAKLSTPNTYPIDPQTLKALRGMNNIWSDANGNIEVSFYTH